MNADTIAAARAKAAEGRRLAKAATPGVRNTCDCEPCARHRAAGRALLPALADAVDALAGEAERVTGEMQGQAASAVVEKVLGDEARADRDTLDGMLSVADEVIGEVRGVCGSVKGELTIVAVRRVVADRDRLTAELAEARAETARSVAAEQEACAVEADTWSTGSAAAAAIRVRGSR